MPLPTLLPDVLKLHWAIADAYGNSIVIEQIDGNINIHNNTVGILTNDPDYLFQLKNLNQYVNINTDTPINQKNIQINTKHGKIPSMIGHGFNLKGLPYDISPTSRFTRLFQMKQIALFNHQLKTPEDCISFAAGILSSMFIVKGLTPSKFIIETSEETQFLTIKDNNRKLFYFKTYDNLQWKKIDVGDIKFKKIKKQITINLQDDKYGIKDITKEFEHNIIYK